jgi:glycosyltransferase involved in cell wall biosynthesis
VEWIDNIPNEEIPKYMNQSKIFVLPSFYEGHPKVLIEAMSCEMTVIVSNVQGNNDVVIDGKNGFLCDTSIVSIQETIIKVLKMSAKNLNMINVNARQFVKDNYSLDKIVTMEMQLYEDIMNENNSKNLA